MRMEARRARRERKQASAAASTTWVSAGERIDARSDGHFYGTLYRAALDGVELRKLMDAARFARRDVLLEVAIYRDDSKPRAIVIDDLWVTIQEWNG